MDFGMLIEVKTELIQGSIDLNIIGTDSHRAPPVSFLIASFYHASAGGAPVEVIRQYIESQGEKKN